MFLKIKPYSGFYNLNNFIWYKWFFNLINHSQLIKTTIGSITIIFNNRIIKIFYPINQWSLYKQYDPLTWPNLALEVCTSIFGSDELKSVFQGLRNDFLVNNWFFRGTLTGISAVPQSRWYFNKTHCRFSTNIIQLYCVLEMNRYYRNRTKTAVNHRFATLLLLLLILYILFVSHAFKRRKRT